MKYNFLEEVQIAENKYTIREKINGLSGVMFGYNRNDNTYGVEIIVEGEEQLFTLEECDIILTGRIDKRDKYRKFYYDDIVKVKNTDETKEEKINGKIGIIQGMAVEENKWSYAIEIIDIDELYGVEQDEIFLLGKNTKEYKRAIDYFGIDISQSPL